MTYFDIYAIILLGGDEMNHNTENSYGLDITDKKDLVAICYTMWFDNIHGSSHDKVGHALNVTELTEKFGFDRERGFGEGNNRVTAFHYWGKPAQGYYKSTDRIAAENNMRLIADAGVDFLILDYTYATSPHYAPGTRNWQIYINGPSSVLLDTITEMRRAGKKAPYVVFWVNSNNMFDHIYEHYYSVEAWKDCFLYWNGKPFVMNWNEPRDTDDRFTVRSMYGLQGKASVGQWSYLEVDNSTAISYDENGSAEHIGCSVATQETYMSLTTAHGRDGGRFWNSQWKNAFEVRPKIVTLTWWNEWTAQLYRVPNVGFIFTDNFNHEYSRDIEPMEGGHGDLYYRWLIEYVKAYKASMPCPPLYI